MQIPPLLLVCNSPPTSGPPTEAGKKSVAYVTAGAGPQGSQRLRGVTMGQLVERLPVHVIHPISLA